MVKNSSANAGDKRVVQFLAWKDPLEEGTATHSSSLAWRLPWTGEVGGLQSIRLQTGDMIAFVWYLGEEKSVYFFLHLLECRKVMLC